MKEKILELRNLGKTYSEIVDILKCSKATVSYHCSKKVRENFKSYRNKNRKKQRIDLKIQYGGKCSICGYNKCLAALDFHHINSSEKDINIGRMFDERGKTAAYEEAKKCILICRNCHSEIHHK